MIPVTSDCQRPDLPRPRDPEAVEVLRPCGLELAGMQQSPASSTCFPYVGAAGVRKDPSILSTAPCADGDTFRARSRVLGSQPRLPRTPFLDRETKLWRVLGLLTHCQPSGTEPDRKPKSVMNNWLRTIPVTAGKRFCISSGWSPGVGLHQTAGMRDRSHSQAANLPNTMPVP